jgi:polyribonucleotide 5'-hydroxyl-kinase
VVACRYEAQETPVPVYLNLHTMLDQTRQDAVAAQQTQPPQPGALGGTAGSTSGQGPRVIIVGPMDSGKSTLTKSLLNWAVRCSWQPTFVDLDVGRCKVISLH